MSVKMTKIKKCSACGKRFSRLNFDDYAYRIEATGKAPKFYCSYSCWIKAEREHLKKVNRKIDINWAELAREAE